MKIEIGQAAIGGFPFGDPIITFVFNNNFVQIRLKDFHSWIDDIYKSKGNGSEKSYKAKADLTRFLNDLIHMAKRDENESNS